MAKGIYKMTNNRTGKVYVGQSNNLTRRKQEHMSKLSKGTHHNKQMQQDFNRGNRFSFQVVEYVNGTRDDLNSREKSQIRNHNSFHGGYNRTSGGDYIPSNKGYHRSRKKYPIGTYSNDDTFGGKCFAGILIALIILFFLSYWPMHFLYGILISGIIIFIAFVAYYGSKYLYYNYLKNENNEYFEENTEELQHKQLDSNRNAEYNKLMQNTKKEDIINCSKCYAQIPKGSIFCPLCDEKIGKTPEEIQEEQLRIKKLKLKSKSKKELLEDLSYEELFDVCQCEIKIFGYDWTIDYNKKEHLIYYFAKNYTKKEILDMFYDM